MSLKLGILLSGKGRKFEAIARAIEDGELDAEIALVCSSNEEAEGLKVAARYGFKTLALSEAVYADPDTADMVIASQMMAAGAEWLAVSDYEKAVYMPLVTLYEDRIVDAHPSLLPAFPDESAIEETYMAGVKVAGASVVIVNGMYPMPAIVAQRAVDVDDRWSFDELKAALESVETRLYIDVLKAIAAGRVCMGDGRRVTVSPANS